MPFVSSKQKSYLAINKPDVYKKFSKHGSKMKKKKESNIAEREDYK